MIFDQKTQKYVALVEMRKKCWKLGEKHKNETISYVSEAKTGYLLFGYAIYSHIVSIYLPIIFTVVIFAIICDKKIYKLVFPPSASK